MISGDVLTDIDLRVGHRLPREERGAGDASRCARWRTRSSSASSSPGRTGRSSASSRSPAGARCSATPSTPGSTCSSPRSSTASPRAGRSTSPARSSRPCSRRASPSTATWQTATGRTWARRAPISRRTRTSSTGRSTWTWRASSSARASGSGKGSSDRPLGPHRLAGVRRRELHHRPGRRARRLLDRWAPTHRWRRGAELAAVGHRRELLSGLRRPGRGRGAGPLVRPADRGPHRARARSWAKAA